MRNFEEMQKHVEANLTSAMQRCMDELKKDNLTEPMKKGISVAIQDFQKYIDNIEEVTTIAIGSQTNRLIQQIQKAYRLNLKDYYNNFEKFIDEYVVKSDLGAELGVGVNELLCFKGRDPLDEKTGDLLRQIVNTNCGTNIPMSGIEEQAIKEYNSTGFTDEIASAKAFVQLKEIQRDSGTLNPGAMQYYPLATDQKYQEAKAICASKKI